MARYRDAKNRVARKFGVNIFGRLKNPLLHKANPPGMHGAKRKKLSDYGVQLQEKQKLRAVYGMITESQLRKYFVEAVRRKQNTPELLLQMLESRLDVVVYRLRFASTIFAAQQLVSHGHICVNGSRVTIRSFHVAPGMIVSVHERSRNNVVIVNALKQTTRAVPDYLTCEDGIMTGSLLCAPSITSIALPLEINVPMICDFIAHGN